MVTLASLTVEEEIQLEALNMLMRTDIIPDNADVHTHYQLMENNSQHSTHCLVKFSKLKVCEIIGTKLPDRQSLYIGRDEELQTNSSNQQIKVLEKRDDYGPKPLNHNLLVFPVSPFADYNCWFVILHL